MVPLLLLWLLFLTTRGHFQHFHPVFFLATIGHLLATDGISLMILAFFAAFGIFTTIDLSAAG